jgi:hypothetical protein
MDRYLIPANSKRSMLILSLFAPIDLIIVGVGGGITVILLMLISIETTTDILIVLTPVLIACAMVVPVPNHRNVWQLTANVLYYFTNQRKYRWRGWCMLHGKEGEE